MSKHDVTIRAETPADGVAVGAVHRSAFETSAEAELVEALRARAGPIASLVADHRGEIVGHILFSPVTLAGHPDLAAMGLAPMAVIPNRQREGIGSALVRAGLTECRRQGCVAVVVLGHPEYYPRFGFEPSTRFGLGCEYDVPEEVFMAVELDPGALREVRGTIRYPSAFDEL